MFTIEIETNNMFHFLGVNIKIVMYNMIKNYQILENLLIVLYLSNSYLSNNNRKVYYNS